MASILFRSVRRFALTLARRSVWADITRDRQSPFRFGIADSDARVPLPDFSASVVVFLGPLILACSACTTSSATQQNFEQCLAHQPDCDSARLTVNQRQHVLALQSQQQFEDCLAGRPCNESLLSDLEVSEVRNNSASSSFKACLRGEAACEEELLTTQQRDDVQQARKLRNLEWCLEGFNACDEKQLTEQQSKTVRQAYLQRNFTACMSKPDDSVQCHPSDLTSEQRELVKRRDRAVNLSACLHGMQGCDETLLTPEEQTQLREKRSR